MSVKSVWHISNAIQLNLSYGATPKEDQKLVFKTDYCLMQVKILQNAPRGAFCNTFDLH